MTEEMECTGPEANEITENATNNDLPTKSKRTYEKAYDAFVNWCLEKEVLTTEDTLTAYFAFMSKTKKSTSLWSCYSMLKRMIAIQHNIDISKYLKLLTLLKTQSVGCKPKMSKILQSNNDLPTKSKHTYEKAYDAFVNWCLENEVLTITEDTLTAYFEFMSKTKKSTSLWSCYSMLKRMIAIENNIDISKYLKLLALLKTKSEGYKPKKSKILQSFEIEQFINEADDTQFLAMKVILIMGYCGGCRRDELVHMMCSDIEYKIDVILVSIRKTKTSVARLFAIAEDSWINLIKTYASIRPLNADNQRFFLNYQRGHCTTIPIGINTIGRIPKVIAAFLNLPNPDLFSGHCFRRSSASHLANHGGDLIAKKRKSSAMLKRQAESKTSNVLQISEIQHFINDADDTKYLAMKIILIMGYCGACRREELVQMLCSDIEYKTDVIVVSIRKTKSNPSRLFAITEQTWVDLTKTYASMRPINVTHDRFFLNYQKGHCTTLPIGINTMGRIPKVIAAFLKLPNPDLFSGHCFRRSSHLSNYGSNLMPIKHQEEWQSSALVAGYIEASLQQKIEVAKVFSTPSTACSSSSQVEQQPDDEHVEASTKMDCSNVDNIADSTVNVDDRLTHIEPVKHYLLPRTGEKSHNCPSCTMSFLLYADLQRHLSTHAGKKTHICGMCGRRFFNRVHLEHHLLRHAPTPHTRPISKVVSRKTNLMVVPEEPEENTNGERKFEELIIKEECHVKDECFDEPDLITLDESYNTYSYNDISSKIDVLKKAKVIVKEESDSE